jgi:porin
MKKVFQRFFTQAVFLLSLVVQIDGVAAADPSGDPVAAGTPPSPWYRSILDSDHLFADIPGRKQLSDSNGITFNGQLINDMLWNTVGGKSPGGCDAGVLQFGFDADTQKLIGLEGGTLHTSWLWIYGRNPSSYVGDSLGVSGIAANPAFRCYELWYEQAFFGNFLKIRGGLLALDQEFMLATTDSLFLNASLGLADIGTFNLANQGPQYPMATPGIRFEVNPTRWMTLRSVFSQANPFSQQQNPHNFNWNFGPSGGLLTINEAVVNWKNLLSSGLPGTAKAGFWIQNGPSPTLPQDFSYCAPSNVQYSTGFYGILDQTIYRPDHPNKNVPAFQHWGDSLLPEAAAGAPEGLNFANRIGFCPQPDNPMSFQLDSALVYTGLIPGRKADRCGVAFIYGQMSSGYRNLAAQQGIPGPSYEAVGELTYCIQVTPSVTLQPDLQYVIHPGGTQEHLNALVAGFRATVAF